MVKLTPIGGSLWRLRTIPDCIFSVFDLIFSFFNLEALLQCLIFLNLTIRLMKREGVNLHICCMLWFSCIKGQGIAGIRTYDLLNYHCIKNNCQSWKIWRNLWESHATATAVVVRRNKSDDSCNCCNLTQGQLKLSF